MISCLFLDVLTGSVLLSILVNPCIHFSHYFKHFQRMNSGKSHNKAYYMSWTTVYLLPFIKNKILKKHLFIFGVISDTLSGGFDGLYLTSKKWIAPSLWNTVRVAKITFILWSDHGQIQVRSHQIRVSSKLLELTLILWLRTWIYQNIKKRTLCHYTFL